MLSIWLPSWKFHKRNYIETVDGSIHLAGLIYFQKKSVSTFCFSLNDEGEIEVQICKYTAGSHGWDEYKLI